MVCGSSGSDVAVIPDTVGALGSNHRAPETSRQERLVRNDHGVHTPQRKNDSAVTTMANSRRAETDELFGISLDVERFFAEEKRRRQIYEMQERIRPGRTTPVAIRFDGFTLDRLKTLAALHNTGYQTLLKEFVYERLYEEERRAGIICEPPKRPG